ncbi:hypothetical protein ACP4OV_008578 [Aristida adscensionis]
MSARGGRGGGDGRGRGQGGAQPGGRGGVAGAEHGGGGRGGGDGRGRGGVAGAQYGGGGGGREGGVDRGGAARGGPGGAAAAPQGGRGAVPEGGVHFRAPHPAGGLGYGSAQGGQGHVMAAAPPPTPAEVVAALSREMQRRMAVAGPQVGVRQGPSSSPAPAGMRQGTSSFPAPAQAGMRQGPSSSPAPAPSQAGMRQGASSVPAPVPSQAGMRQGASSVPAPAPSQAGMRQGPRASSFPALASGTAQAGMRQAPSSSPAPAQAGMRQGASSFPAPAQAGMRQGPSSFPAAPAPAPAPAQAPKAASPAQAPTTATPAVVGGTANEPEKLAAPACREPTSGVEQGAGVPGAAGVRDDREEVPRARQSFSRAAGGQGHLPVVITPESSSRKRNKWLFSELVELHKQHLNGRRPVYDGRKGLFTAGPLPFKEREFVLKLINPERANQGEKEYKVRIKDVAKRDMYSLQQFLAGRLRELPQETIQALDIALRECPSARYVSISRSFFSPAFGRSNKSSKGVEGWSGYYQSLRPTQMGLSLNINISATAFYKAQPIIDFALEYLSISPGNTPSHLSDQERIKLKKALKGVRVVTTHRRDISMRYKITGLTSVPLNDLTFDQDGTRTSVVQYFRRQYNCRLKYIHWPCLQAGNPSRPTYLPMEVCNILEGQRYSSKLNTDQVKKILDLTCKRPPVRESTILEVVRTNNYSNDYYAKEFGLKVINQLALVDARVLPAPLLKYHDSGRDKVCNPFIGQWNMNNERLINGGSIKYWACVTLASSLHPNRIMTFCDNLFNVCDNMGMKINGEPCLDILQARPDNLEATLRNIQRQSAQVIAQQGATGKQLDLLIIVLPDGDYSGVLYGRAKRICETELGLITQCCMADKVKTAGRAYLQNLALKINVKVGGRNTCLKDAVDKTIPLVTDKPTVIFGADVTHPAAGEDASPSISAVVASMDWPGVSKYRCLVSSQSHRQEIITDLFTQVKDPQKGLVSGGMIRELLMSFYFENGQCKPGRIIFYRDGVSEGQFSQVLLYEMDAIRKACASLEHDYLPPVTFIVVQKRHHTRLFPEDYRNRDLTDKSENILPGTVVDTKICHPSEFDFYLCSHAGLKGTSRPTHYHVLYDENKFTADGLQTLTYNLCYTYARCTRSVSVVPPAYYAHLAAFRARHYLDDRISDDGSTSAGGSRLHDRAVPVQKLPAVKESAKRFMFYC